jgi:hypothetical protein
LKFNPDSDYILLVPEVKKDEEGVEFLEFEDVKLEYKESNIDYNQMLKDTNVEVKVFNELFLDKEIEYLDVLDLDLSYPLYM